jgi:micrococcal nuclease
MRNLLILAVVLLVTQAGRAAADPCEAIPEVGPMPAYLAFGATFSGPVVDVLDGDSLCVAVGPEHKDWVEVRLADFYAPESGEAAGASAKAALARIALGKSAVCVAGMKTYDRVAARCQVDGRPIGDLMRGAHIAEGGRGTGRAVPAGARIRPRAASVGGVFRFKNCAAARAAGVAPMRRGDSAYNPNLDGDGDGVACEPIRRR